MNAESVAQILLEDRLSLTGFIRSMVRDAHSAEDIFQETCVKAIARSANFHTPNDVRTWARTVARNQAIDSIRRSGGRHQFVSEQTLDVMAQDATSGSTLSGKSSVAQLRALETCLKTLSPKTREVVSLRYGQGLAGTQVAARLQRKVTTVYKMLARAYSHLRGCIETQLKSEVE